MQKIGKENEEFYEQNSSQANYEDGEMIVSFQDEFGGYSSRLRIDSQKKRTTCDKAAAKEAEMQDDEAGPNVDVNLC